MATLDIIVLVSGIAALGIWVLLREFAKCAKESSEDRDNPGQREDRD